MIVDGVLVGDSEVMGFGVNQELSGNGKMECKGLEWRMSLGFCGIRAERIFMQ